MNTPPKTRTDSTPVWSRLLREHPDFEQRMRLEGSEKWVMTKSRAGLYAALGIVGIALFVLAIRLDLPVPEDLRILFLAGPVLLIMSVEVPRSRQEKARKIPARVLGSREEEQDSPERLLLVTLERERGKDLDYRVESELFEELVDDSIGIARVAGPNLLSFDRFDA